MHNFKYVFSCASRKISNFEKWLALSRSLATPSIYLNVKRQDGTQSSFISQAITMVTEIILILLNVKWPKHRRSSVFIHPIEASTVAIARLLILFYSLWNEPNSTRRSTKAIPPEVWVNQNIILTKSNSCMLSQGN